jgi:integrase
MVAQYRDSRLETVQAETVRRELSILRHVLEIARRDWGVPLSTNAIAEVQKPPAGKARNRRLEARDFARLIDACGRARVSPLLAPIIRLAVETGMRRGEILNIRWSEIDAQHGTLHIPHAKNGYSRTIPLTTEAIRVIASIPRTNDRLFPKSPNALRLAWERLKERAGVADLHFHDLRHEAITRLFERGLSLPEVALISGHRDPRMLFRYTHLRPEDVAKKLNEGEPAKYSALRNPVNPDQLSESPDATRHL